MGSYQHNTFFLFTGLLLTLFNSQSPPQGVALRLLGRVAQIPVRFIVMPRSLPGWKVAGTLSLFCPPRLMKTWARAWFRKFFPSPWNLLFMWIHRYTPTIHHSLAHFRIRILGSRAKPVASSTTIYVIVWRRHQYKMAASSLYAKRSVRLACSWQVVAQTVSILPMTLEFSVWLPGLPVANICFFAWRALPSAPAEPPPPPRPLHTHAPTTTVENHVAQIAS